MVIKGFQQQHGTIPPHAELSGAPPPDPTVTKHGSTHPNLTDVPTMNSHQLQGLLPACSGRPALLHHQKQTLQATSKVQGTWWGGRWGGEDKHPCKGREIKHTQQCVASSAARCSLDTRWSPHSWRTMSLTRISEARVPVYQDSHVCPEDSRAHLQNQQC